MSSRKILVLAISLPILALTVYSFKHNGKTCGGEDAEIKEFRCPKLYECVTESNEPNAGGVCRFLPGGLRSRRQTPLGNETVYVPSPKDPTVEYGVRTKKAQRLTIAHNKFGFEILKKLAVKDGTERNIIISPTSLGLAFNMIYNGSNGPTKDQMTNTLLLSGFSQYQLNESAGILLERLNVKTYGITTGIHNSVWVRNGISLNENWIKETQNSYGAPVSYLDFNDPSSPKAINNWVNDNTGGKISSMVPDNIDPDTVSYILNTAYFNGVWKYKFDPEKITDRDFRRTDGTTSPVKSMTMTRPDFLYLDNNAFQAVKMPYGSGDKYSMIVMLPKKMDVNDLVMNLSTPNWESWISSFAPKEGTLYFPKYHLEYESTMNDVLKQLGMTLAFDPQSADFSKLSADGLNKDFYISQVLHKTYIDVNEEGAEAAAATSVSVGVTSVDPNKPVEPPFEMDVNKPFFFAIINEETQANVFTGIVRQL